MNASSVATDVLWGRRIDAVIDAAIAGARIVGAVVLVARDGTLVYSRAAGAADREAQQPMRTDAIFRYSSLTKPIVSATALALIERGALGLEDALSQWIPELTPRLADGRTPLITTRHLLSHTAGFNYGFFERGDEPYLRANVSDGMDQPGLALDENLRRLNSVPLLYEPGTSWGTRSRPMCSVESSSVSREHRWRRSWSERLLRR
jgi:CubicO group peptidase (beta-lactamase class C family)